MFLLFYASFIYSAEEVTGVQTGPVCVGTQSDYLIYDCFMEEIKNDNNDLCSAIYFVDSNSNYQYNLNVEKSVFFKMFCILW